jgi:hypothetical protein
LQIKYNKLTFDSIVFSIAGVALAVKFLEEKETVVDQKQVAFGLHIRYRG